METRNLNIRVPKELHAALQKLAEADRRTLTQLVRIMLEAAIQEKEGK